MIITNEDEMMDILIDEVRISGFRGIEKLSISLSRISILVGTNNSGKTSVIRAISLALGDYSRYISEEDFHIDKDEKRVSEIVIDLRIVPVDENGVRISSFSESWQTLFGDSIQAEANGFQYSAMRTRSVIDSIKGGFNTTRFTLERWVSYENWLSERVREKRSTRRSDNIPYLFIDAQRDLHQELKEKSSFVGRFLSNIEYHEDEIAALEELIRQVNDQAVDKSTELALLKEKLNNLNQSFKGSGNTEITPFPKKLRDLNKHFSVHFGESSVNSFSMEYHGMGTRSWASILTAIAFTDMMSSKFEEEVEPFYPVIAAEEPEAHLHPSAQKTLYKQLSNTQGQIIISSHSPYLAAMAKQSELRHLKLKDDKVDINYIRSSLEAEDKRQIDREVIKSRGEILFSNAIVLCEGETEEQALPLLFKRYFVCDSFEVGINFIGVGGSGRKYLPFLYFCHDLKIPVYIFSDGEAKTISGLQKNYEKVYGDVDVTDLENITILDQHDFESYLISDGFKETIVTAIENLEGEGFIASWIESRDGTSRGRKRTQEACETCHQNIFEDIIRDYKDEDGYNSALCDILDSKKTKFAPEIANELCKLESDSFPSKLKDFFEKLRKEVVDD